MTDVRIIEGIQYTLESKIGTGAFGIVYKAIGNKTLTYAVKDIICKNNDDLENVLDEVHALGSCRHKNVVSLISCGFSQHRPFEATISLLLEYCSKGNLNQRLSSPSSNSLNYQWMYEILE